MNYNSADDKARCYEGSNWLDCSGIGGGRGRSKPFYSTGFLGAAGVATLESWQERALTR